MELFNWFYLRALNTDGHVARGRTAPKANPCTDGLGNPITAEIARATPWYTISIAILRGDRAAARLGGGAVAQRKGRQARRISGGTGVGLLVVLAAIALADLPVPVLPFTTIDGTYASTFEFFMGSTLAHLILLAFIVLGLCGPGRQGPLRRALVPGPDHPVLRGVDRRLHRHPGVRRRALLLTDRRTDGPRTGSGPGPGLVGRCRTAPGR